MKKTFALFVLASLFVLTGCQKEDDIHPIEIYSHINGVFSVSPTQQVHFASGNLEYDSIYHFAEKQYDYGGYFGWGTGNHPADTSISDADYPTFNDWGSHIGYGWHTLSIDEWRYVLYDRPNASDKCGAAVVCGVNGMILLPDDWTAETVPEFHSGFDEGWNTNVYDTTAWAEMEAAGAVFLPASSYRDGSQTYYVGLFGLYWSSTPSGEDKAYDVSFFAAEVLIFEGDARELGLSVRLVQNC